MKENKSFQVVFEENAFDLDTSNRPGGSAHSIGRFINRQTGEFWLGKSDIGTSVEHSLVLACREKLANEFYAYFGIRTARLRISLQEVVIAEEDQREDHWLKEYRFTQAWHVMSRWLDRFQPYGYLPDFIGGSEFKLRIEEQELPERGLGHILAVAHWINDIDVLNPTGKNIGYQLQLDEEGQLFALSCKIDPGFAFSNFHQKDLIFDPHIKLATLCPAINFNDLPQRTKTEYLQTLQKIIDISRSDLEQLIPDNIKQELESSFVESIENYFSIDTLLTQLVNRQQALQRQHQSLLKQKSGFMSWLSNTMFNYSSASSLESRQLLPPLVQHLHQRQLHNAINLKEKLGFYIPLDVSYYAYSEYRQSLDKSMQAFINDKTHETFLLLGASGAGKSLFTQQLVYSLWQAHLNDEKQPIPLRIELKQFSERTVGQCIINTLLDEYQLSPSQIHKLQQYRFLFILDGYDEMGGQGKINLIQKHRATEAQHGVWENAQFLITCRNQYFDGLERSLFYGYEGESGLQVYYLQPIRPEVQLNYLAAYRQANSTKKLPDYAALLTAYPTLHELLGTPLILRLFRDALPHWQRTYPQRPISEMTQYALYTAFMNDWFNSEAIRLCMQKAEVLKDLPDYFLDFSLRLAVTMYEEKVDEVQQSMGRLWEEFFSSPKHSDLRAGSPLRRYGGVYSFVHKSFLEYFVARYCWQYLKSVAQTPSHRLEKRWPQRLLGDSPVILQFLQETFGEETSTEQDRLKEILLKAVHQSKGHSDNEAIVITAANAITLLNTLGTSFVGPYGNLEGICIRGADLEGAILDHANLAYANLRDVNFTHTFMRSANLQGACLTGVRFGEQPYLVHECEVNAIYYSADGKRLVTASGNEIKIWDTANHELIKTLFGHTKRVTSVALSADGRTVASSSSDNTVKLWDSQSGICRKTFSGHTSGVTSVFLSANGGTVISGSRDKTVKLWNSQSGACRKTFSGHKGDVTSVSLNADGCIVSSGSRDGTVKLWDRQSGACRKTLVGHTGGISSVSLSANGHLVVSGSYDSTVKLWDSQNGACQKTLVGHANAVISVFLSADGRTVVSGSKDKMVKLWDSQSGACQKTLLGHIDEVTCVSLSTDGRVVVSGSEDNTVRLWDSQSGVCQKMLLEYTDEVTNDSISLSVDGRIVAWDNRIVTLWKDGQSGVQKTLFGLASGVSSLAFSANGHTVAWGNRDTTVKISLWDSQSWVYHKTLVGHRGGISSVSLSADGRTVVSGSWDETIKLWDSQSGACRQTLVGHTSGVVSVALSTDGRTVASVCSRDYTIRLWDSLTGQCLYILSGYTYRVNKVVINPHGIIITRSDEGAIKYWQPFYNDQGKLIDYQLFRSTHQAQGPLWLEGCQIEGAKGLSFLNQLLLKQRGVVGQPASWDEISDRAIDYEENIEKSEFIVQVPAKKSLNVIQKHSIYSSNNNSTAEILKDDNSLSEMSAYLQFNAWYHPDICHYLIQMINNQAQCLRVVFNDAGFGNNTQTFKTQLRTLIVLANRLDKPAVFIGKEPGAETHFICGLLKANNLILINPMGKSKHDSVYQTLGELQQERTLAKVWLSNTVLQRKEFEKNLVSCGPISLELALHILSCFKLAQLQQFWNSLETDEATMQTIYQLNYIDISINDLLSSDLRALMSATDEMVYKAQIMVIRQHQLETLKKLANDRANQTSLSVENYLKSCKENAYAQVTFNALLTGHYTAWAIHDLPEYTSLAQTLSIPESSEFIYSKSISENKSFKTPNRQNENLISQSAPTFFKVDSKRFETTVLTGIKYLTVALNTLSLESDQDLFHPQAPTSFMTTLLAALRENKWDDLQADPETWGISEQALLLLQTLYKDHKAILSQIHLWPQQCQALEKSLLMEPELYLEEADLSTHKTFQ